MLTVVAPIGEVFPYIEEAKKYLLAGMDADIGDYVVKVDNPQIPVQIQWECDVKGVKKFLVEYARNADYADAVSITVDCAQNSVGVYNLYKATKYYVRVSAIDNNGAIIERAENTFTTTALGPRVMNIEGICNVRDFGGYQTLDGKEIAQGVAYRGGSLMPLPRDPLPTILTENGKKYLRDTLGVKTEIDLRSPEESGVGMESIIPGVKLLYLTINGYDAAMKEPERYRKVFSALADKNNYPLYYHCTAGSDRTGTVSFILSAFLGVSELDCIKAHEFSSFSIYGERNTKTGESSQWFHWFYDRLQTEYAGETLQEKATSYLISIGVTQEEMQSLREIFLKDKE